MNNPLERATFAGGCFWCTEAIFNRVKGVIKVTPGYAGADGPKPTYNRIHHGESNAAESVQIEYDPNIISYEALVKIFFGTHNPTTLHRQGNDIGKEYRSTIFFHTQQQKLTAERVRQKIEKEGVYENPIVTTIEPFSNFYEAEPEHKNFYTNNPDQPYCQVVIDPKIAKFRTQFAEYLK